MNDWLIDHPLICWGLTLAGVFTAISQGVPAGISALIPGLKPIVTSTLANRLMGEKITRLQSVGLALGLVGVLLVLDDRNIVLAGSVLGWVASFLSLIGSTDSRNPDHKLGVSLF